MVLNNSSRTHSVGRETLSQEVVDNFKRERVAVAIGELTNEAGINAITVSLITKQAKMARNTFYDLFENRDSAIRYSLDLANRRLRRAIEDAAGGARPWEERVGAVIDGFVEAVSAAPALSSLCLLHGRGFEGSEGLLDPDLVQALAGVMHPARQEGARPEPGSQPEELMAYGILSVVAERLRRGEVASIRALAPELSELARLPFLDPETREPVHS